MGNPFHRSLLFCVPLLIMGCGDVNDPIIGFPGISTTAITSTSISLSWIKATDGRSDTSALVYKVYLSGPNPAYQSFDTIGEVEAGTLVQTLTDADSITISSGIVAGNTYYFNIVVEDEKRNKALYDPLGEHFHSALVYYYPFQGNSNDVAATANNLTVPTVPAGFTSPSLTLDRFGHPTSAYNFNPGTFSQCLESTVNVGAGFIGGTDRSMSFWVQSSNPAAGATRAAFAWGDDSGNGTSFGFIESGLGSFWTVWLGTTNPLTPTAVTSSWEHWVIVSTGGIISAYKNGNAVAVPMGAAIVNTLDSHLYIGCGTVGAVLGYPYQGNIDDVRIFNLALGPTDVTNLYAATRP